MSFNYELKVVSDKLPLAPDSVRRLAGLVVNKTVHDIEAHAKQNAPVDTGFLKSSIQAKMISETQGVVSVGAEYGIYVEYGTRFQAAQPYLGPAVTAVRSGFESAMEQVLNPDNWTY